MSRKWWLTSRKKCGIAEIIKIFYKSKKKSLAIVWLIYIYILGLSSNSLFEIGLTMGY